MALSADTQSTDSTSVFLDHWKKSKCEVISSHANQFHNELTANGKPLNLRTTQIRVLQQPNGDPSCGYYGIYFTSKLSQIFQLLSTAESPDSQTTDSIMKLMQDLQSRESFDHFKASIMKELLAECSRRNTDSYPWIKVHVNSGVLERVYLQYLQNNYFRKHQLEMPLQDAEQDNGYPARYEEAIAKQYGFRYLYDVINLMEFSDSALKTNHLPLVPMDNLEYFFNKRFLPKLEHFKIFLIGSAIHFVVAAIYRNQSGDMELLYLDPQNNDVLYKSRAHLQKKVIARMTFESWLKYGWKIEDMRKLAMDSFRGIQFTVTDLVTKTVYNLYSKQYNPYFVRDKLIQRNISHGFLAGFKSQVLLPMVRTISNESVSDETNAEQPITGLFVGVNQNFTFEEKKGDDGDQEDAPDPEEEDIDANKWKQDCDFVMNAIMERLSSIKSGKHKNDEQSIKKHMRDIQTCSCFAKLWISTYYPSAVIDQNIVNVVNKLGNDSYIPTAVLKLLYNWSSLMMVFANANNRKLAEIEDDKFWKRLASTLLVVQMVTQTDASLTKL